jgi:hypothetical protein
VVGTPCPDAAACCARVTPLDPGASAPAGHPVRSPDQRVAAAEPLLHRPVSPPVRKNSLACAQRARRTRGETRRRDSAKPAFVQQRPERPDRKPIRIGRVRAEVGQEVFRRRSDDRGSGRLAGSGQSSRCPEEASQCATGESGRWLEGAEHQAPQPSRQPIPLTAATWQVPFPNRPHLGPPVGRGGVSGGQGGEGCLIRGHYVRRLNVVPCHLTTW